MNGRHFRVDPIDISVEALGKQPDLVEASAMRRARCPICDADIPMPGGERPKSFPFCGERCRNVDLGRWFNESYPVPVETERVLREAEETLTEEQYDDE